MNRAKRILSLVLVLTLLCGMLPASAGSAETASVFSLSQSEVRQLETMSGLGKDTYREGTPYSKSMSAYQVYCWMTYFDEEKLGRLITQIQQLIDEIGDDTEQQEKFSRVYEMKYAADQMNRDLCYYSFQLNEQMSVISNYRHLAIDSSASPQTRADAYRRMQQAGIVLKDLLSEIAGVAPLYENDYEAMFDELSEMHGEQEGSGSALTVQAAAATLVGAATPFANLTSAGFYIDVLNVNEAGFFVCDENGSAIMGAKVTVTANKLSVTAFTDEHGIAKFDTGRFGPDQDGKFLAAVTIRYTGCRVWESCGLYLKTGTSRKAVLAEDDGTPYVQRADFRGMDVLHEQDVIYCTPENDAVQTFDVYVHADAGQSGSVVLNYTDVNGNTHEKRVGFTGSADSETQHINLNSRWASELYPNAPFILSLETAQNGTAVQAASSEEPVQEVTLGVVTKKAAVNRPVTQLTDPVVNPGLNMAFTIPIDVTGLESIEIGVQIPAQIAEMFPVSFSFDPSGEWSIGIAFSRAIAKGDEDGWKTVNTRDFDEDWDKSKKQMAAFKSLITGSGNKDSLKGEMKEYGHISEAKLMFSLMLVLTGKFEVDSKKSELFSDATLLFQASFGGTYKLQHMLLAWPPVFFVLETSASVSGGAAVSFSMKSDGDKDPSNLINWRDLQFNKEETEIFFGARFALSASLGIGIRYILAAYVRGFFGISAGITFNPWADDVFGWFVHMEAGLDVVVEALFVISATFHIVSGEWEWPKDDDSLTKAAGGADGTPVGVNPTVHRIPSDLKLPDGLKTACVYADDETEQYLGCYLANGQMHVVSIYFDGSDWSMTELNSYGCFGTMAFSGEGTGGDRYIYDFAVAGLSESEHTSEIPDHFIAVSLLMADHAQDADDPDNPGQKIPGKTYGETVYIKYSADADNTGTLTAEGGMKIAPQNGCYTGVAIDFGYLGTVKSGSSLMSQVIESYYVTTSMANRSNPGYIFAHAEKLDVTEGRVLDAKATMAVSSKGVDHFFDLRSLLRMGNDDTVFSYQVRSYYQSEKILFFDADYITMQCVVLYGTEGHTVLGSASASWQGLSDLWQLIETSAGMLDSGNITQFVSLGTEKRTSNTDSGALMYLVFKDPDETGSCEAYLETQTSCYQHRLLKSIDLGVRVAPVNCFATRLTDQVIGLYYPAVVYPDGNANNIRYEYKALYFVMESADRVYISKPFTMAVFSKEELDPVKGIVSIDMMRRPVGFLQGVAVSEATSTPGEGSVVSHFTIQQTPQIRIDGASIDNPLVRAGDTINILMTVTNTGNVPASAFMLNLTAEDVNTGETTVLSQYKVNCAAPADSLLMAYDLEGVNTAVETGEKAVSRFETADADRQSFWSAADGSAMLTTVLMPEETVNYRVPFTVPKNFAGHQYNVTLSVGAISMIAAKGENDRYDSTGCWIYSLQQAPDGLQKTEEPVTSMTAAPQLVTVTAILPDEKTTAASADGTVPLTLITGDIPMGDAVLPTTVGGTDPFCAYGDNVQPSSIELDMSIVDVALEADIYELNGEPYVYTSITNGSSAAASGVKLSIRADGEEIAVQRFPDSYLLTCNEGLSMDIPIGELLAQTLGSGQDDVDRLTLKVSCDQDENNSFNNSKTLYLSRAFVIIKHPEDQTVTAGEQASFDVVARGGTKPYSYQWQVSTAGQNGPFADVEGATERVLTVDTEASDRAASGSRASLLSVWPAAAKADGFTGHNGDYYRCIVTDARGRSLTSDPALLLVREVPATGDAFNAPVWGLLAAASLMAMMWLTVRRKKKGDC